MYAELNISSRSPINVASLSIALKSNLAKSAISPQLALSPTPLAGFIQQAIAAASFPDGTIVAYIYLSAFNELVIYVWGKSLKQIKERCEKLLEQVSRLGVRASTASAKVMIPMRGTDVDILTGSKAKWSNAFWGALKEKLPSKVIPSALVAGLTIYFLVPAAPAKLSTIIAFVAAFVGVIVEAVVASWGSDWKWKESK